ncbi:DEAD/DEAH box helicase family protein [Mesorhizobium sp.]|uniref:DEAD/DEAH box helicase n=1 Tax=Mesorhizobium sp. TaxID=1871066 RepID=UPI000FE81E8B|nr:DEAD/DEAH box helicase family protein [Mesorhizobium sp.]RWG87075.1 MAG: type III restriction endonuclease subunit R [Mesorhizobium sp.]TIR99802.1 MAG: type III restriction endonuclease subunit R [Mesorhizobium sp.]
MNRHVNAIAGRLSLRAPQRQSLEILDRVTELVPLRKGTDLEAALAAIRVEFPSVTDFERDFPSLCFALATGVGKTRLMGAFIAYLHLAHGLNNFFVLAPNLTIYNKLIADFTPNTPKYVLKGIAEFAISPPVITTGDNFERQIASGGNLFPVTINIFNISKINSEVRGGRSPRIRSFKEEIGDSYFDYLATQTDLVLIMDESHRYRATAGVRAINELKPVMGLELTATPFVETTRGPAPFQNVIFDYPLGRAMADGFVKEPAVVTRENFVATDKSPEQLQQIKLKDGVRLHESVKVELETYARQVGAQIVKPFMLVIARDITHATELMALIKSEKFFGGRYADKVIQVDSSVKEEETINSLLLVESPEEPTEIVIHVNMLKEGWDVTNLYTIVPLRAANARTLIEQSIGRGLRLPYGRRTGVTAVDRLNIVAHDRFQEIVDEARKPDSAIRLQQVILTEGQLQQKTVTVESRPQLAAKLGLRSDTPANGTSDFDEAPAEFTHEEQHVVQIAYDVIRKMETEPSRLPSVAHLQMPEVQAAVLREVQSQYRPPQLELDGIAKQPDLPAIVAKTVDLVVQQTIDIPRILVTPKGEVKSGFHHFTLDLSRMRYEVPNETLWAAHLRTGQVDRIGLGAGSIDEQRLEDYVVSGLIDFDDVAYDAHADLLYDLASQVANHLLATHPEDGVRKILHLHQKEIARFVHAQMQNHFWQDTEVEYEVVVTRGFTELRKSAYTVAAGEAPLDFRQAPADKANMARYLFGGFQKCLYPTQKFQSDAERKLAVILDREAQKWFKPARGQFQLFYRSGTDLQEYQPDFVAETDDSILMLEPKASNQMSDPEVLAKRDSAVEWCRHASSHSASYGGKPWRYALIPHDAIAENMTLAGILRQFAERSA